MWEDGLSDGQTAALFNIRNAGCLSDWERRYETGGIDALAAAAEEGPERCPSRRKRRRMRRRAAQYCWRN
ncbi:helix-turn-helix domain-containing protein [Sinorhizobium meliloti]|nr:helix-turn-helix domain-containing protein [Sinorhizobium meliloti]